MTYRQRSIDRGRGQRMWRAVVCTLQFNACPWSEGEPGLCGYSSDSVGTTHQTSLAEHW